MIHTEPTADFESFEHKRHYQMLKAISVLTVALSKPANSQRLLDDLIEHGKLLYRRITEEKWGSEPVEEKSDG